jgi:hypothetical protein
MIVIFLKFLNFLLKWSYEFENVFEILFKSFSIAYFLIPQY